MIIGHFVSGAYRKALPLQCDSEQNVKQLNAESYEEHDEQSDSCHDNDGYRKRNASNG